ncbi:lipopolysaccharide heptosyltransferase II [bacterium]|nr:lipopolysaccharide heptosyltransferase II [bacterium]
MLLNQKQPQKILLRSPNWVGDAIMATPVPNALKRTNPTCQIHVLAKSWVAPVWALHPQVDQVIVQDKQEKKGLAAWFALVCRLRAQKYTLSIILPNSFSSAWLALWAGCKKRIGYATGQRGRLLTNRVPWSKSLYHWPRPKIYLNLARRSGADVDLCQEWNFTVRVSAEEMAQADALLAKKKKKYRIGLAPGSVALSRRWPVERYAQLADCLQKQGHQVVLLGSPQDQSIAEKVAKKSERKPQVFAGRTSLRLGLAMIKRMDLVVSNDSGAMHMAYAQGVLVLVLQGAADHQVTGPFGKHSAIIRDANLACSPCVRNECPKKNMKCMRNITVAQVCEKVNEMLKNKKV